MAFTQSSYPNVIQGIDGKYTIAQIGCFLTSFANLEERYGKEVNPPTLNAFFRDNNVYTDIDDGVRDDVSWDTITSYDPSFTVIGIGTGPPEHDNSIVKFVYNNGESTHFCLVQNAAQEIIIDSWDGSIKPWSFYGGPKEYATYTKGENMPSIVGSDIIDQMSWTYFGYGASKDFVDLHAGEETNAFEKWMYAHPNAVAYRTQIATWRSAAESKPSKFKPYTGTQLYVEG